jgi:SET domain-containing protein
MAALYQDPPDDAPPMAPPYACRTSIKTSSGDAGRGLFALRDIAQGERVHLAHCILVPKEEYESHCRHTVFEHYLFNCR